MVPRPEPRPSAGAEESSTDVPAHRLDALSATPPGLDTATIERLAEQGFGVPGSASPLGGERDQNFRVDSESGRSLVFKVSNPADGPTVLDLQAEALRHAERHDPELPLMQLVPTRDGTAWGKPMGNGHPLAAVVTRADIADALMDQVKVFSTFGGNPVRLWCSSATMPTCSWRRSTRRSATPNEQSERCSDD